MALTDTFVRNVKHSESAAGDKYTDGRAMYLLVNASGKYWRMNYRFAGKRRTLALGVYPDVGLAKARQRREKAREQLADGVDPAAARREDKQALADAAANTFEKVARDWWAKTAAKRAEGTQTRVMTMLKHDVFPYIGDAPISTIGSRDVLDKVVRKIEARGSIDTAHRAKQVCGQIFPYGVAVGLAERDVTSDLRGAITSIPQSHFAAITEPKHAGQLMRSIFEYAGHATTVAALKLSIRHWWFEMGQPMYKQAKRLLITADCGGSNGYRVRLWRLQLQRLADEIGLEVQVCHFPPGTSKWNKIEHRMFCHITNNWRGRPLLSRQVVVNLIGSVTTDQGLRVKAALDENTYEAGIKVSDADLAAIDIKRDEFHGEWNYRVRPRAASKIS